MKAIHDSFMNQFVQVSQAFPLGIGAATFYGVSIDDWIKITALIVGVCNILWFGLRFYDWFDKRRKVKK